MATQRNGDHHVPGNYYISSSICQDRHGDSPEVYGLESEIIVSWSAAVCAGVWDQ